jgi:hypothetical protein
MFTSETLDFVLWGGQEGGEGSHSEQFYFVNRPTADREVKL